MAAVGATVPTLVDVIKGLDPAGNMAPVAELLSVNNEIMADVPWKQGNLLTGNLTSMRTALPTSTWRLLNGAATVSKSAKSQQTDQCAKLEVWSEVDVALAKLANNLAEYRLSESKSFVESMSQEFTRVLFYGNAGLNPEQFTGLATRFGAVTVSGNIQNVIDGGGTGSNNTSVWLIGWGDDTVFGIYPKGSMGGLQRNDFGEQTVYTATGLGGGRLRVLQEQYIWDCGIAVPDWRYIVRLCNINTSNLVNETTPTDLANKMIRMMHKVPNLRSARMAFYMNRTVFEMLDIQRREDVRTGGQLRYDQVDGLMTPTFRQIPVRICDSLVNTESRVV